MLYRIALPGAHWPWSSKSCSVEGIRSEPDPGNSVEGPKQNRFVYCLYWLCHRGEILMELSGICGFVLKLHRACVVCIGCKCISCVQKCEHHRRVGQDFWVSRTWRRQGRAPPKGIIVMDRTNGRWHDFDNRNIICRGSIGTWFCNLVLAASLSCWDFRSKYPTPVLVWVVNNAIPCFSCLWLPKNHVLQVRLLYFIVVCLGLVNQEWYCFDSAPICAVD